MPKQYLDANGNPIPLQAKTYLDPNTGEPAQPSLPAGATGPLPDVPTPSRNLNYVPAIDSPTNLLSGAWSGIKNMVAHPIQTASGMGQPFVASGMAPGGMYPATAPMGMGDTGKTSQHYNTQVQGAAQEQQGQQGLYAAGHPMETAGNVVGPALLTAGLTRAVKFGGPALKGVVTGNLDAPIPGMEITPRQRYAAMRETGVQPDAAQATNSPLLRMAKAVNENSLTSSGLYENARTRNLGALGDYTTGALNEMSPLSPEEGGAAVQKGLLEHHEDLKAKAQEGFTQLEQQTKGQQIPGAKDVAQQARQIVDQNAAYYKEHPELAPHKALAIVQNLARKAPPIAPEVTPGFGSAASVPPASAARVKTGPPSLWSAVGSTGGLEAQPRLPGYSELHQLRSDLLEFNNANPDFVKNRANSWISNLAGVVDKAITSGEGSLTPDQVKVFRDANTRWNTMKSTYDNPQNPLYHAARSNAPSTLVKGISRSPEMAQTLKGALGGEGMGPIQRGVAEDVLGRTATGDYNFKTFQGKFNRQLSPEYQRSLYTPEQQRQLGNIGQTGSVLNWEPNPSGTAKLNQKIGEAAGLAGGVGGALFNPLPLAGQALYHGGQYVLGRAMNSPAVVDWLMRQPRPSNASPLIPPLLLPASTRR